IGVECQIDDRERADPVENPDGDAFHRTSRVLLWVGGGFRLPTAKRPAWQGWPLPARSQALRFRYNLIGTKWLMAISTIKRPIPKPRLQPISRFSTGKSGST